MSHRVMKPQKESGICLYPFSRMVLGDLKFVPCCASWLTEEYHALRQGFDLWNGPAAIELRRRILSGDTSLCRREICLSPLIKIEELKDSLVFHSEHPMPPENLEAILSGKTRMPQGPGAVVVTSDPRCNLACPSCRDYPVFKLEGRAEWGVQITEKFLGQYSSSLRVVKMAGDGEVFFSPFLRRILKDLHRGNYPNLDYVFLLSNGLLANQRNFELLKPGSESIRRVSISVDAGNEQVYQKVRGGNWKVLMKNLRWLSKLRACGKLDYLNICFVMREENFRSMLEFVELGKDLGVDHVMFSEWVPWARAKAIDTHSQAVHKKQHPKYREFFEILHLVKDDPMVQLKISIM